ncbi:hypothetical protein MXB_1633, partial [Myxobolus squamalis]
HRNQFRRFSLNFISFCFADPLNIEKNLFRSKSHTFNGVIPSFFKLLNICSRDSIGLNN